MNKTLMIVESPAKAKKISGFLGDEYIVKASVGHIADLAKGGPFNLGVDLDNGFKPKYSLLPDKKPLLDELEENAKQCKEILLCGDPDREGAGISFHLYSRLLKCGKPFRRVLISEITKKAVEKAIKEAGDINSKENIDLFHSQEARRVLDRIVGFMASPFLMAHFGPNLSAGRVQSVITKMIVDREHEIDAFNPETYFVIKSNLTKDGKESFWTKVDKKVLDKNTADEIKNILIGSKYDTKFVVTHVDANEELRKSPPPMITSQLQKVMSKSFGMKPDVTMKAAQSLYENGYVTYIRTDSVRTDPDAIKALRAFLKKEGLPASKTTNAFKTKDAAQDAHECIRPTDLELTPDTSSLSGDEKLVYDIIWKYFVASQMEPAAYNTLKVTVKVKGNDDFELKTSGKALKSKGFLEVMGVDDNSKIEIPDLQVGDELSLIDKKSVTCEEKQTQPPPRFSNFSLIEIMEKKNIGRPATYADVLSKITNRNYVEMEGTTFRPTELGKQVTNALSKFFSFMEYNYTAELEKKLDDIAAGKQTYVEMLTEFFVPFKSELDKAYISNGAIQCEKCNSPMKTRQSKSGDKFLGCSAYPNCKFTKQI